MAFDDPIEKYETEDEIEIVPSSSKITASIKEWYDTAEIFVKVLVFFLIIFTLFARFALVDGRSMVPTLHHGERLIVRQIGYNDPQYGDIVVIDRTRTEEAPIVKRIIGKAGDIIYIDFVTHEVWRNDTLLDEPYINEPTELQYDVQFPVSVPEGAVFVMGDNRNHSDDSRNSHIGMVDLRNVMGKVAYRFFPIDAAGGIS